MSDLIKENTTESVITMAQLRFITLLGLLFIATIFLSTLQPIIAQDVTRPNIYGWGMEGEPELGNGFDVWANVTDDEIVNDDDPNIRNVTVRVLGPNMTFIGLMTHNGTFYTGSVPTFPNEGTFNVRVKAYDMANNSRTSSNIDVVFDSNPTPTIPQTVTMPIVVSTSITLIAFVAVIAVMYDRRKGSI
ncbi:MAG: hypothetical protein ACFFE1_11715 [Candidatus Thorarchaeota archaeon]